MNKFTHTFAFCAICISAAFAIGNAQQISSKGAAIAKVEIVKTDTLSYFDYLNYSGDHVLSCLDTGRHIYTCTKLVEIALNSYPNIEQIRQDIAAGTFNDHKISIFLLESIKEQIANHPTTKKHTIK